MGHTNNNINAWGSASKVTFLKNNKVYSKLPQDFDRDPLSPVFIRSVERLKIVPIYKAPQYLLCLPHIESVLKGTEPIIKKMPFYTETLAVNKACGGSHVVLRRKTLWGLNPHSF